MKRYLITMVVVMAALVPMGVAFGQGESKSPDRGGRDRHRRDRAMRREEQANAIKAIEEQVAKLKAAMERRSGWWGNLSPEERDERREKWENASEEEKQEMRAEMRERYQAAREELLKAIEGIEEQIAKLKENISRARQRRPGAGRKAADFTLKSFDGKTVSLSDYKGKIVVLEWFNFECPFSIYHYKTKTTMVDLAKKYKDKNVVWLSVNSTNHTTAKANNDFSKKYKLKHLILDDRTGDVGHRYGATNTPHMYIIDAEGNIVYEGAIDNAPLGKIPAGQSYTNYVDKALAEMTGGKALSAPKTKPYGCTVKYPQ